MFTASFHACMTMHLSFENVSELAVLQSAAVPKSILPAAAEGPGS